MVNNGLEMARYDAAVDGRDGSLRTELGLSPETVLVTAAGRVNEDKGFDLLVEAAIKVVQQYPQTVFLICGATDILSYRNRLEARIGELGLEGKVRLLGRRDDLPRVLAQSDVFVLSSRREGHPYVLLEAMACGLPTVATLCGGVEETLEESVTGYGVPIGSVNEMAASIGRLVSCPQRRHEMGEAARRKVKMEFTAERSAQGLFDCYERLLNSPPVGNTAYGIDLLLQATTELGYLGTKVTELEERLKRAERAAELVLDNPLTRLARKLRGGAARSMVDISPLFGPDSSGVAGAPSLDPPPGLSRAAHRFQQATCLFLRTHDSQDGLPSSLRLPGQFELIRCQAGGWLLYNREAGNSDYWLPVAPIARRVSPVGHLLEEMPVEWAGLALGASALSGRLPDVPTPWVVDAVVWELRDSRLGHELQTLSAVETEPRFLLGSHTRYQRPADLYRHLIHGHIYEDRYAWPHQRKVCSENDAHALWQILAGLELATSRELYHLLKSQVLLAVLDRQGADGGFRHGEWTEDSESHYRLHCSAMHLFMDALAEEDSPGYGRPWPRRRIFWPARRTDSIAAGGSSTTSWSRAPKI